MPHGLGISVSIVHNMGPSAFPDNMPITTGYLQEPVRKKIRSVNNFLI